MKNGLYFAKAVEHLIFSTGTRQAPGYFRKMGNIECIQFRIKTEFAAQSVCIYTALVSGTWFMTRRNSCFMGKNPQNLCHLFL